MRLAAKWCLQALGLAVVYLMAFIFPLIDPSHNYIYHLRGQPWKVYLPVLISILMLSIVFFGVLTLMRRSRRFGPPFAVSLLVTLPWVLYRGGVIAAGWPLLHWIDVAGSSLLLLVCVGLFCLPRSSKALESGSRLAEMMFAFCGLSAMLVIVQLIYFGGAASRTSRFQPLRREVVTTGARRSSRVIWVLLDELSFDQVYGHRFAGLALPAFDDLAQQSTVFTQVIPAGIMTEEIVPSLLTGMRTNSIRSSADGRLVALENSATGKMVPFSPGNTVFADALRDGYSTSVVGWYNPYCRMLAPVLEHCTWRYTAERAFYLHPESSVLASALRPVAQMMKRVRLLLLRQQRSEAERTASLQDFRDLEAAADRALADPSQTMLFLHLPIPHPPAFYDRQTHAFEVTRGSYVDALALADLWVAHLKEELERQHEWDSSTVILMGDHSWRTQLIWGKSAFWSAEDQEASHGMAFDPRPMYLVKLPGQTTGARIEQTFEATRTRALLDALLSRRMQSPAELKSWAAAASPTGQQSGSSQ